jgi:hypothetical protein
VIKERQRDTSKRKRNLKKDFDEDYLINKDYRINDHYLLKRVYSSEDRDLSSIIRSNKDGIWIKRARKKLLKPGKV